MNAADKFLEVVMLCLLGPTMLIIRKVVILACIRHAVVLLFIRIPCAGDVRHSVFVLGCVFPDRMPCNFLHGSSVSRTAVVIRNPSAVASSPSRMTLFLVRLLFVGRSDRMGASMVAQTPD